MTGIYVMDDATNPANIETTAEAVAGYDDGLYAWPSAGWARFLTRRQLHISVFASPVSQAFDVETGNAPPAAVANAVKARQAKGLWSWVYVNLEWWPETAAVFKAAGIAWRDRSEWPAPGPYLWPADWSGHLNDGTWTLPVAPVAVQTGGNGQVDWSNVYVELDVLPPTPTLITVPTTEDHPMFVTHDSTAEYLVLATGKVHILTPEDGSALTQAPPAGAGLPYVALSDAQTAAIPDAH